MSWWEWALVLAGFCVHGRAVRLLGARVAVLEDSAPDPDKGYHRDIGDDREETEP